MRNARDPLLFVARYLVGAIICLFAFVSMMITIGLGAVLTMQRDEMLAKLSASAVSDPGYSLIVLGLVLILVLLAVSILFMRELFRIVGSVEEHDPFQPINADRLRRMGWFALAAQATLIAIAGIASWFGGFRQALVAEDAIAAATSTLVLTLVLFILARVFRVGAEMREELEGTV